VSTIERAKAWLELNHPSVASGTIRASKYHSDQELWFFTLPTTYFDPERSGDLNILLQLEHNLDKFHYLKVPFSFFARNREKFDIRSSGNQFDLHISSKKSSWLVCERSKNVSFNSYEQ